MHMRWIALAAACTGAFCAALPGNALFFAIGLTLFGALSAVVNYRHSFNNKGRLLAASTATIAIVAFAIASAKYVITLAAIGYTDRL